MLIHGCKRPGILSGVQNSPSILDEFAVLQDKRQTV